MFKDQYWGECGSEMRFKVDSLQLKVNPGIARREEEAQLRRRQRRVGVKANSEGSEDPRFGKARTVGHPACGVVGLGSLGELELAIRRFANDKFKTEAWGTRRGAPPPPRVELSTSVHWVSWSLRSEYPPTTNSKGKAWGTRHPACGVVGLGSLVELELAIRVFANNKFKKESLGHPAHPSMFKDQYWGECGSEMRFKVDSLQLKVNPGIARREEEAQLRRRQRRVGVKADSEGPEDPRFGKSRTVGHPAGELSVSVHWLSWSLRSECLPKTSSRMKAWGTRESRGARRRLN